MKNLSQALKEERIQNIKLRSPLFVSKGTPIQVVFEKMRENRKGYVVVRDGVRIGGIFTERDALTRVIGQKGQKIDLSLPVEKVMTENPKTLKMTDSVADAIVLMNQGSYRHIPIVDRAGEVQAVVGVRDIVQYLAEHYPYEVYNLPPDPHQIMRSPDGA